MISKFYILENISLQKVIFIAISKDILIIYYNSLILLFQW